MKAQYSDAVSDALCSGLAGNGESVPQLRQWSERMKKQRKRYTPEEKVGILRRHLLEQVPISELCDKHGLQPTVIHAERDRKLEAARKRRQIRRQQAA
jgi:transposase-like protein